MHHHRLERVWAEVERGCGEALERLKDLVRVRSVSADTGEVRRAVDLAAGWLRELGAEVAVHLVNPNYPLAIAHLPGADRSRRLLLYNHVDVVPPGDPGRWHTDPFEPAASGGFIYGRGISDNKGPLLARIAACRAWLHACGEVPFDLVFLVDGQEEVGCPGLEAWLQEHGALVTADACLWEGSTKDADGVPTFQLGVKGKYVADLTVLGPESAMHNKYAPVVENPIWELVRVLGTLRDPNGRVLVEGFYDGVDEFSPAERQVLRQMAFDLEGLRAAVGRGCLRTPTEPSYWEQLLLVPELVLTDVAGGETRSRTPGILAQEARARLSVNLVPSQDADALEAALRAHLDRLGLGRRLRLERVRAVPPYRTPLSAPIARHVARAARAVYGVDPIVYPLSPGSGPLYTVCGTLGLPAIAVGISHAGSAAHGPNESIRDRDFLEGAKLIAAILESMDAGDQGEVTAP